MTPKSLSLSLIDQNAFAINQYDQCFGQPRRSDWPNSLGRIHLHLRCGVTNFKRLDCNRGVSGGLFGYLVLVVLEHSVESVLCFTDDTQRAVHQSLLLQKQGKTSGLSYSTMVKKTPNTALLCTQVQAWRQRDLHCHRLPGTQCHLSTQDVTVVSVRCFHWGAAANTHQVDHQRCLWGAPGFGRNVPSQTDAVRVGRHVLDEPQAKWWRHNDGSNGNKDLLLHWRTRFFFSRSEENSLKSMSSVTYGLKTSSSSSPPRRSIEP